MKQNDNEKIKQTSQIIEKLRKTNPLIDCITNYVTVNDCANAVLALGASPAMSTEELEAIEFTQISNAVVINMGSPLQINLTTMQMVALEAKKTNTPLILDPVAVGVTSLRNQTTQNLIKLATPDIIRGNMSEIKAIGQLFNITQTDSKAKGVDVAEDDIISNENVEENAYLVAKIAKKLETTIAVSGVMDIITNGDEIYLVDNGNEVMSQITGTGCMLTCIMGAYSSVANPLDAAIIATLSMTIAGDQARNKMIKKDEGSASFRTYLIDELYKMNAETIIENAKLYKIK
ncbi:hydroxyethylthiazole kinase [Methanosphaera cuniculi]|uniref:hydroxyethylthiazole kinase n=1 Tax=Methanosphaera cuniculi TaxID=1077256 RepID=UPI0026DD7116|nr:hydroxyethylthiazole kinase [Methanosphaera cuniculi]